jgi:hypothetical protein
MAKAGIGAARTEYTLTCWPRGMPAVSKPPSEYTGNTLLDFSSRTELRYLADLRTKRSKLALISGPRFVLSSTQSGH